MTGEIRLHVEREGQGPALVLLHGFTGSGRSLAALAREFRSGHETLLVDLPGHGRSIGGAVGGAYDFEATVAALVATLRGCGHDSAHWFGYSMGARLALGCAVRHPWAVRSLVLVGARAGIEDASKREARRRDDEILAARIEGEGVERFVDEWQALPMFATQRTLDPITLDEQRRIRLANTADELAASLRGLGPGAQPSLFDELSRVTAPALLMAGATDERFVAHAQDLASRLQNAEVRIIEGAGHAVHLERPRECVAAMKEMLSVEETVQ